MARTQDADGWGAGAACWDAPAGDTTYEVEVRCAAAPDATDLRTVSVRVLEGKPFVAFTQEVIRGGHDLLIKPADAASGTMFFGSTDMHLLRKCPSAVWITNREEPPSPKILVLVDPDPAPTVYDTPAVNAAFAAILAQIVLLDIVFSLDSVITAVGMVREVWVMITAVILAVIVMLLAVNMNFVAFSHFLGDISGQVFVFFILTVAAAEAAIGLAILVVLFRNRQTINVDDLDGLKG